MIRNLRLRVERTRVRDSVAVREITAPGPGALRVQHPNEWSDPTSPAGTAFAF